jgi:hypothetical protein
VAVIDRRRVLAALAALPFVGAEAKKKRTTTFVRPVVHVKDYTSVLWNGIIPQVVDDFNAVMPSKGPRLVYERHPTGVCPEDIDTCSGNPGDQYAGLAWTLSPGVGKILVTDTIPLDPRRQRIVACHEFMHILTGIKDCYGCREDSCVHGWRETPGPFDIWKLKTVWGGKARKKRRRSRKRS